MSICHNNPKKSSATKINKHTSSGIHCVHIVRLMQQTISLIIAEIKTVWKDFVRI